MNISSQNLMNEITKLLQVSQYLMAKKYLVVNADFR